MNFWKRLLGKGCSHRFSWPRIDADGGHYQICLLCGTAYEYDWTRMRRTARLVGMSSTADVLAVRHQVHPSQQKLLLPPRLGGEVKSRGGAKV
jgi:hypothetical protein